MGLGAVIRAGCNTLTSGTPLKSHAPEWRTPWRLLAVTPVLSQTVGSVASGVPDARILRLKIHQHAFSPPTTTCSGLVSQPDTHIEALSPTSTPQKAAAAGRASPVAGGQSSTTPTSWPCARSSKLQMEPTYPVPPVPIILMLLVSSQSPSIAAKQESVGGRPEYFHFNEFLMRVRCYIIQASLCTHPGKEVLNDFAQAAPSAPT